MLQNFTEPQISTANPTDWYVWFRFLHGGKWHPKKYREGINFIHDKSERLKEAKNLLKARQEWLKMGWNPVTDPEFKARKIVQAEKAVDMQFCEAMDFALEKKKEDLAKNSYEDYEDLLNHVKAHAEFTGLSVFMAKDIKRVHMLDFMEKFFYARKMSNHRYNTFLGVISSMFTTLQTWSIVEYNPMSNIPSKIVAESDKYAPFIPEEKKLIYEHLAKKHYRLYVCMLFVYHCGLRPAEVLALRKKDIDLTRRIINIVPNLTERNSKTNFIRPVVIPNELYPYIKEMGLEQYPDDFFVFGSPFTPGKGNRGSYKVYLENTFVRGKQLRATTRATGKPSGLRRGVMGAMRPDYLAPSPCKVKVDTVTALWKVLVKDEPIYNDNGEKIGGGLGINKCFYAAKRTGGDDKILAGIDLDALRNLYGHRSKYMTEKYAKQIFEIYRSNIRDKAPAFTGKGKAKIIRIA